MQKKAKITFYGGTGTVTGANFLLEIDGRRILVDCGLTQGVKVADDVNWDPFPYDPRTIDILFVTHGHVDHIGRIPKLIAEGFRGQIYSTEPTRAIALPMLEDTASILSGQTDLELDKIYTAEKISPPFFFRGGVAVPRADKFNPGPASDFLERRAHPGLGDGFIHGWLRFFGRSKQENTFYRRPGQQPVTLTSRSG